MLSKVCPASLRYNKSNLNGSVSQAESFARSFTRSAWLAISLVLVMFAASAFADQTKANNHTALQLGGSWVSGTAPGSGDNAIWNSTVSTAADCTNSLGSAVTWNGIVVGNPAAPVSIDGSATLTLNNGINLASATRNLVLNCDTIAVAASQTWNVASGITLTTGSATNAGSVNAANNFVRLIGGGTWIMSGTGDNGSLGVTVSAGTVVLNKASSSGVHAIGGPGLSVNLGATVQLTGTGGDQISDRSAVTSSGIFDLNGNSETVGSLSFSGGTLQNSSRTTATLTVSGNLTMNGSVSINDPQASVGTTVILQYAGTRSGSGSFVAGSLPAGATVVDNPAAQTVSVVNESSSTFPQVVIPTLNTNEMIVAATTPQQYGAKGDGITDDSAAFQAAMNAVYNSGGNGGGVIYVPPANYAFAKPLTIPNGVTLQGDWQDWTKGTSGLVGTTFKVYAGAGKTTNTPFITMDQNAALKDVNIWYPDQNPNSITPYPSTIEIIGNNCVVQNVALVNSYLGITANGGSEWILSTVIGTPLALGLWADGIYDICQTEDIRFSPAAWANSGLTNAPTAGGAYAAWMLANGTGMQIFRVDGVINVDTTISGYNLGLDFEQSANGNSGCAFYHGYVTNCNIAVQATSEQNAGGLEFSACTLIGGMAINANVSTNHSTIHCSHCTIVGTNGTAVYGTGANWSSVMAFQDCVFSNLLDLAGPGVFNLVDCSLSGSTQCVMSASATRAAFTGCTFSPTQKIINHGRSGNLIMDSRSPLTNAMPAVNWTNVINNYVSRRPASSAFYVATGYGATGNGTNDDTAAINRALTAAGNNGGGIVYLPPGNYHTTNTLQVPSGVELRGAYELRHGTWGGDDGIEKGSIIDAYGGQGTTNGPPAVALAANSGLVGLTFNYPNQTYDLLFPPTIQGQGANVYIIGVQCAEPWIYVDLDTYTCTNHLLYMVDGWALNTWVRAGNGSSGTIADTHGNPTYWVDNPSGQNQMNWDLATGLVFTNGQTYVLGHCTELFVKVFSYGEKTFMHCGSEGGVGPNVTAISAMCDGTYQSYIFDATGPCTLTNVNSEWWCAFNQFTNWPASAALITTTNFTGTVRFLNVPLWGGSPFDYEVNGGDIGLELVQLPQAAGSVQVNGGVFHLVNAGMLNGAASPFLVSYGMGAGVPGQTNEFIGCYAYNGCNYGIGQVTDLYAIWNDYALASYQQSSLGPVVLGDFSPNGEYQFQPAGALAFMAYSPNGINSSGITVRLIGTNLLGQGYVTNYTITNGLGVLGSATTKGVSVPLVTNAVYTAIMRVTDMNGNFAANIESFDTISPAYTFEAEDFDADSGNYINHPQTNAYAGLIGVTGIDYSNGIPGEGSASYRPQGLETEPAGDQPRLAYATGLQDYDVGFANPGNWGNYTRFFPTGTFNIYMRSAGPTGPLADSDSLYQVSAGQGTQNQTSNLLGTFAGPNTGGWQTYAWVPLLNSTGGLVDFTGGSVQTLRVKTVRGDNKINCYLLVATNTQVPLMFQAETGNQPVLLQVLAQPTSTSPNLTLQWPDSATWLNLYYTASLTPPVTWTPVTNAVALVNNQWMVTLPVGVGGSGFYQLQPARPAPPLRAARSVPRKQS